jgi:hypothetical protein
LATFLLTAAYIAGAMKFWSLIQGDAAEAPALAISGSEPVAELSATDPTAQADSETMANSDIAATKRFMISILVGFVLPSRQPVRR